MAPGVFLLAFLLSGTQPCALVAADQVQLAGRDVRLAEIVELDCVTAQARSRLGDLVVARLPQAVASLDLPRSDLEILVRRRVPGLALQAAETGAVMRLSPGAATAPPAGPIQDCYELAAPVARDQALAGPQLQSTPCSNSRPRVALRYDRQHGVVRANRDADAGGYVGSIAVPSQDYTDTGAALTMRIALGAVQIERPVWAVQPAVRGERVFVRDADGHVFPLDLASPPASAGR